MHCTGQKRDCDAAHGAPRRALTEKEKQRVAANEAGRWGHCSDCCGDDAYNNKDELGDAYVIKCSYCKNELCEEHLHACDMCPDYVCNSCIQFVPSGLDDCPCFCFQPAQRTITILSIYGEMGSYQEDSTDLAMCRKHWRICEDGCREAKCLCHFSGQALCCRECEDPPKRRRKTIDDEDEE